MAMIVKMSEFEKVVEYDSEPCPLDDERLDYDAVQRGELEMFGVYARIVLSIPVGDGGHPEYDGGEHVSLAVETPGVWGIATRSAADPYFDEVFAQEAALLAVMLRALGVEVTDDRRAPEVCPACLGRTGGIAEPDEGRRFAVELKEPVKVAGRVWPADDGTGLYPVFRSGLRPHHLVAEHDGARQPICQLPPEKMEVWTVGGEELDNG